MKNPSGVVALFALFLAAAGCASGSGRASRIPRTDCRFWAVPSSVAVRAADLPPTNATDAVTLAVDLAANETESVQLALRAPALPVPLLSADPDIRVELFLVGNVDIKRPTDMTCRTGLHPDPLFFLADSDAHPFGLDNLTKWHRLVPDAARLLPVGTNATSALWFRVTAKPGAKPGLHPCAIKFGRGWYGRLNVRVRNFALPERTTLETAFGLNPSQIMPYFNATNAEQKAKVWARFMAAMSAARLSPYDPAELAPWTETVKDSKVAIDFTAYNAAIRDALARYHFNTFLLPIKGIGTDDPLLAQRLALVDANTVSNGWEKLAYVYWTDEPEVKDYPHVLKGMDQLKRYAPHLRRMLTEEMHPGIVGGPNLWCPQLDRMDLGVWKDRKALGEQSWWYICCWPKQPYVTEFIDHPLLEKRLWAWQTWQADVSGILIWDVARWHCFRSYHQTLQDPYTDPMSWVDDTRYPPFTPWGNGDGRFFYPPLEGRTAKGKFLDADPIPTIRLENLRDGIEDYEYFAILWRLLAKAPPDVKARYGSLLEVPPEVSRDRTHFASDPAALMARRSALADAIEDLTR